MIYTNEDLEKMHLDSIRERQRELASPVQRSPTEVYNRVQYAPNYEAKTMSGMEEALTKVGKRFKR